MKGEIDLQLGCVFLSIEKWLQSQFKIKISAKLARLENDRQENTNVRIHIIILFYFSNVYLECFWNKFGKKVDFAVLNSSK